MRWLLCGLLLLCLPVVLADIVVTPSSQVLEVEWYSSKVFQVAVRNNNSFPVYNLTFSPLPFFSFPVGVDLQPNESRVLSYSVLTNELFSGRAFVSTLSFFYLVNSSPATRVVEVNITSAGMVPQQVSLMTGDSVRFNNQLSQGVELRDFGSSGFVTVPVGAGQSVSRVFAGVGNFSYFNSPFGFTGRVDVVQRSGVMWAHDSSTDQFVSFSLSSVLPAGTVQINLLSSNITARHNETYVEALVELRNSDPNLLVRNVRLSANRWVSGVVPNGFDLPAGGVQRVLFNITPFVERTGESNRSQQVVLTVQTDNAGNATRVIEVFVPFVNLDVVTIGGVNYTITVLGVNETIEACLQHMNEVGFESCQRLREAFRTNVTVVREVEAQYRFSEGAISSISGQLATFGGVSERLENKMNLYLDKQADVELKVERTTEELVLLRSYVEEQELLKQRELERQNLRFWIFVVIGCLGGLLLLVNWLADNVSYCDAMQEARQL